MKNSFSSKHIGSTFGQLTVIAVAHTYRVGATGYVQVMRTRCSCGNEREVIMNSLRNGQITRCEECQAKRYADQSAQGYRHPLYGKWTSMLQRCHAPHAPHYRWYGARGIYVCDRWRCAGPGELGTIEGFRNFVADMGLPPDGYTLERRNNDGPYSPDNCVWATPREQSRNTRRNRNVTVRGRTQILADWAEELGVPQAFYQHPTRNRGWTVEDVIDRYLDMPLEERNQYKSWDDRRALDSGGS